MWELYNDVRKWRDSIVDTTEISWVKGHAKQEHIDNGVTTPYDKAGNDLADAAADEAYDLPNDRGDHKVIQFLAARHNRYFKTYTCFLKMFAAVIAEAREQRDALKKQEETKIRLGVSTDLVKVVVPWYDNRARGNSFQIAFQTQDSGEELDAHTLCFRNFLTNLKWRHTPEYGMHGTTWLELTLAYLVAGGTLDGTDNIRFARIDIPALTAEVKARITKLAAF